MPGIMMIGSLAAAPGVRLRFAPKPNKDVRPLREGLVDLEIGVLGESGPEVRMQALFQDRFVGVVRKGHPLTTGPANVKVQTSGSRGSSRPGGSRHSRD